MHPLGAVLQTRRGASLGAVACMVMGTTALAGEVYVISRERVLRDAAIARQLGQAEARMTKQLQALLDQTKADLEAEEVELTRLRTTLTAAEFDVRVADFDRRVRLARRLTQERAGLLQKAFQESRAGIVALLPMIMEQIRIEVGAGIIVTAESVLAMDPAFDLTERAIALLDAAAPDIAIPEPDVIAPLFSAPSTEPKTELPYVSHVTSNPSTSAIVGTTSTVSTFRSLIEPDT